MISGLTVMAMPLAIVGNNFCRAWEARAALLLPLPPPPSYPPLPLESRRPLLRHWRVMRRRTESRCRRVSSP